MPRRWPALTLALVAAALLLPSLVLGTHVTHSSPQNLTWAAQFSQQFRAGILYPRWMPESFDGLGGPAFYFYPPMAFWVDALASVATGNLLSLSYRLAVTAALLLLASGLAVRAWLKVETGHPRIALWGAIAYMAAPYHLLDHYMRGALAEFAAYAALPIVMLGIRLVADRRRDGPIVLALGYAALVLSHLPTALLASLTVIPAYVLFRARPWSALWRCGAAGLLGLGLASIYLVPALALQEWIAADAWWTPVYDPMNWLLFAPSRWPPEPQLMPSIIGMSVAAALIAVGLGVVWARLPATNPKRLELLFWIALSLAGLCLMAGVVPWIWQIGLIARVQFPWRMMVIVEFSTITAVCVAPLGQLGRAVRYLFVMAAIALAPAIVLIGFNAMARFEITPSVGLDQRDMKPNEPRGFPQDLRTRYDALGLEPLAGTPLIACQPTAMTCRAQDGGFGALTVEIDSEQPTTIVVRRFFFPSWRADDGLAISATTPYRLVSAVAPAGHRRFRLYQAALPVERWSWAVSGASLLVLLIWFGAGARGRS